MPLPSRREFSSKLLGSLMAYGLIETLFRRDLFGETSSRSSTSGWPT